jgi:hypothetical protein
MSELFIVNQRMLDLWAYAVKTDLVADDDTYCKRIGFVRANLFNVKTGAQGFTTKQILAAAEVTGANLNWLFGLEKTMFRENKKVTPMQMLKQAVAALEQQERKAKTRNQRKYSL